MKIAPLVLLALAACSSATAHPPADAGADPLPHLIGIGAAGEGAEGLDASTLATPDAGGLDVPDAAEGLDASTLATPDAGGLDVPDAGPPNACGGLGAIACARPPCVPGEKCATVYGCGGYVCADCPGDGADPQCADATCAGSWLWECDGENALRCSNGRVSCQ
jgi:hypothetical protein